MGNCECLRNNEDTTTEIKQDFQLKGYEKDYGSTSKGKAKNMNNFIFDDDEEIKHEDHKKEDPPVLEDRFHAENEQHSHEIVGESNFAATFKPENPEDGYDILKEDEAEQKHIININNSLSDQHKQETHNKEPDTIEIKAEEEKILDRSTMSGESDLEGMLHI